ncbi:hypothetical protein M427DRAFT_132309 [Gonapodya prolifera JEL478]|uniref:Uncharacterized protein n=1 Tax=Gonapodya prolifera (strain JEL478) TaxID=1344416 RepID=A0A139ARE3_GONPJ|nr:hypothetical protein M427DRAFT_132309 [Gonapodya prolifera JEL478]|eukprot:KXS19321.1 hypothetical protein M427DRAFT_132309 [Gonapodya prolifera JEL478]
MADDDIDNMDFSLPAQSSSSSSSSPVPTLDGSMLQSVPMMLNTPSSMPSAPGGGFNLMFDGNTKIFYQQLPDQTAYKDWGCLYPIYFDLTRSGSKGRRLAYARVAESKTYPSWPPTTPSSTDADADADATATPPAASLPASKKSRGGRGGARPARGVSNRPPPPPPPPTYPAVDTMTLTQACNILGLPSVMEKKRHPQDPFRWGRVRVRWRVPSALPRSNIELADPDAPKQWTYLNPSITTKRALLAAIAGVLPDAHCAALDSRRAIATRMRQAGHVQMAQMVMHGMEDAGAASDAAGSAAALGSGSAGASASGGPASTSTRVQGSDAQTGSGGGGGGGGKKKKGKK